MHSPLKYHKHFNYIFAPFQLLKYASGNNVFFFLGSEYGSACGDDDEDCGSSSGSGVKNEITDITVGEFYSRGSCSKQCNCNAM